MIKGECSKAPGFILRTRKEELNIDPYFGKSELRLV
jgi:hypothetical protein